jgi:ribonuclease R
MKQRRGEIRFVSDETKIKQDDIDVPYEVVPRDQRPSERLIENFMVAANESVAEFLEEYDVATYRIHDVPLQKKMEEYLHLLESLGIHYNGKINTENVSSAECQRLLEFLEDEKLFKVLNKRLLRCMPKAVYSTENRGHFGIASPKYTHFTSPIRRFDDLLNHTSIGYILNNEIEEDKFIKSWRSYLTTICEHISECERNSEKCEYAVDDMLKAYYMQDHIGDEFEATVDTLLSGSFFVQTDNYIDGRCDIIEKGENNYIGVNSYYDYNENIMAYTRNNRVDLRYGDRVLVRCTASNPEAREIDFALIRKI